MSTRNLDRFFEPRSVALYGASPREGSVGRTVARNILTGGFSGEVWFVNPKGHDIDGHRCLADTAALPGTPDLAVIATPPATVPGIIEAIGERGTRAAVVLTAGLGSGPDSPRAAMLAAAARHGVRVVGANCLGIMAPRVGLNASFAQCNALEGDLAFISQSGAIITSVLDWATSRGVGFSHVVSMGNMDDVDVDDMLDYLAGDAGSRAILLYLEGIRDARSFMSAARRAARVKPVVVIKAGRHAESVRAAKSHTGALAGSDAVYDAAFARAGLLRVYDLDELFDAAETLSRLEPFSRDRLAIVTNGGGAGILAVERLADFGGAVARLTPETMARLDAALPPTWSRDNPVDIVGDAGEARYRAALDIVLDDTGNDAVLVMYCPTALQSADTVAEAVIETVKAHQPAKPVLSCWLGEDTVRLARRRFEQAGIPTFATPGRAVRGFSHVVRHARAQQELMRTPPDISGEFAPDIAAARAIIAGAIGAGRSLLTEAEAKGVLAAYQIPVAETLFAADPDEVGRTAERLLQAAGPGGRCAVKIVSHDISHKSDVGGVRLNVLSGQEAASAAAAMAERVASALPDARIEGFVVQPMILRPRSRELIVGLADDPTFGPVVLFGAGGTAVEVMDDKALALPPLDMILARSLMARTRIHRLLQGFRDWPAADLDAIALTLVKIAQLATDIPEIRELDINPLLADQDGVIALDARIVAMEVEDGVRRFAIKPYPSGLEEDVVLQDGLKAHLRPVRPEDERYYEDFFAALDPADVRLRLLAPVKTLSNRFIARLTQIDYAREMAFMAFDEKGEGLLGVSRLAAEPDGKHAEFAIIVRSDLKGRGLGWILMQKLIAHARAEGLAELHGDMFSENTTMLAMCRELGFRVAMDPRDPALCTVSLDLRPATA